MNETGTRNYYAGTGSYAFRVVAENAHGRRVERRQDTADRSVVWVITRADNPTLHVTEVHSTRRDALDALAKYDLDETASVTA